MLVPTTVLLSGTEPLVLDNVEVPVIYTTMPVNTAVGSTVVIGAYDGKVVEVTHILSDDGSRYERLVVYVHKDKPATTKVRKQQQPKLTPRKVRVKL